MENHSFELKGGDAFISDYTDLAVERRRADTDIDGVKYTVRKTALGKLEEIRITSTPQVSLFP